MTGSRLSRTVLVGLALGLFALETVAFTSMGRTAHRLAGSGAATAVIAGKTAARVLVEVAARGVGRAATGVAARLAAQVTRQASGPVRMTATTIVSSRHACGRGVGVVRTAHGPRSAVVGCRGQRQPLAANPT